MTTKEFENYLRFSYKSTSSFKCGFALFLVDAISLLFCVGVGFFIINLFSYNNINFKSFKNYTIFLPIQIILYALNGLYPGLMISHSEEVKKCTTSTFITFLTIILIILFGNIKQLSFTKLIVRDTKTLQLVLAFVVAFIFSIPFLPGIRSFSRLFFGKFSFWGVPTIIYCTDDSGNEIVDRLLKNNHFGYKPCAIINASAESRDEYKGIPVFPSSDSEIFEIIKHFQIKNAILCEYKENLSGIMSFYRYTISVSKNQSSFTCTQQLKEIGDIIAFASTHNLTITFYYTLKRFIDILIILFFSPIIIPIFVILMLLVKCTSKGPVFYGHKRIGKNGKEFKCWKFRTMVYNSQEILEQILATDPVRAAEWEAERKFKDDPRITKFGKFLRKTSLDELPQLINILLGQMSLVGPRPVTKPELEKYGYYKNYVLSVLPGLSGMWQVNGRSETSYEERIYFDTFYIQNWSIWLDLWILIKTVYVVIKGKGAY